MTNEPARPATVLDRIMAIPVLLIGLLLMIPLAILAVLFGEVKIKRKARK